MEIKIDIYVVEYRDWNELTQKEFNCDNLLELFEKVNYWMRRNCIHDDAIESIEIKSYADV